MVKLVQHDLEFILRQIKVAEAHSAAIEDVQGNNAVDEIGDALRDLVDSPLLPYGLRTVDGSYNNLVPGREKWGASGEPFPQLTDPNWVNESDDAMPPGYVAGNNNNYGNAGDVVDADPRLISNLIVDQTLDNPAAVAAALRHAGHSEAEIVQGLAAIRAAREAHPDALAAVAAAQAALTAAQAAVAQALEDIGNAAPADIPALLPAYNSAVSAAADATAALATAQVNADAAADALDAALDEWGVVMDGPTVQLPNVAPDEGLSASYNSWFTLFGQFFDHGLDLVKKGGNGTVYIPLSPDDPLYNPASPHTNFMVLTRVTTGDGAANVTTPWVDQNQTYTSHASHQVFLREYTTVAGRTVDTGHLLEGVNGGLATWKDIKDQAREMLGIELTDADVGMVPLLRTDPYGNFIPDANGYAQVIIGLGADGVPNTADDVVISGTPSNPASLASAVRLPIAFLDDIAHDAATVNSRGQTMYADHDNALGIGVDVVENPHYGQPVIPGPSGNSYLLQTLQHVALNPDYDTNLPISASNPQYLNPNRFYDSEKLDAHYITGDGRGNENIGLTAVHFVFHAEHNRQIEEIKKTAVASGDVGFLNEWLLTDVPSTLTAEQVAALDPASLVWDGARLFQAARFATEMQYQHLVFEEFARKVQPDVDLFLVQPDVELNPAIFAEFANVVYRFGHSMLNQSVDRTYADGSQDNIDLFDAFLNPLEFGETGISQAEMAGAIALGMSAQRGNEIDEFVTDVLRNQLVGIPLDLAAINIARGRDTGMPTLNQARAQFQEMANGDTLLRPYTSWADYALNLKTPESIINFIAAYGTHASLNVPGMTAAQKRDAAMELVFGVDINGGGVAADRLDFLNARGIYADKLGGLDNVDLWIGGLAEKKMAFGGLLGSTFSFIFQLQMENLQDSDRFYYLSRTQGLNLLTELENNSLAKMIMRNTNLGEDGLALPADVFSTPDHIFYMDLAKQLALTGLADPTHDNPVLQAISALVERVDANSDGVAEYLRYNGLDHIVIQGTDGNDHIVSGGGDDTVWGGKGNDRIEAGYGVDSINGGEGDDIITSAGTDIGAVTVLKGETGNDVIVDGTGSSLIFGGEGKDYLVSGYDDGEIRAGQGNDFVFGGDGSNLLFGNEGDDWVEGGGAFDYIAGDNGELFFNSTIIGHDVLNGGSGDTDYDADSGDDIMFAGEGIQKNIGMWGFDWVIHQGQTQNVDADMRIDIFTTLPLEVLRDRFSNVEAVSGWHGDDILRGDDRTGNSVEGGTTVDPTPETTFGYNELDQDGIDRIAGLGQLITPDLMIEGQYKANASWENGSVGDTKQIFVGGNVLLGGGGSDLIEGRGGDDVIDGDRYLNVRLIGRSTDGIDFTVPNMESNVTLDGVTKSLTMWMVEGRINPGALQIVREILDGGAEDDVDTAVYWDVFANYEITSNADGSINVNHVTQTVGAVDPVSGRNRESDGNDRLWNIEQLRFADRTVELSAPQLFLQQAIARYEESFGANSYTQADGAWTDNWVESGDTGDNNTSPTGGGNADNGQIRINNSRLEFDNGNNAANSDGAVIQRGLATLAGATSATISYNVTENLDAGETVTVEFSRNGIDIQQVQVIGSTTGNNGVNQFVLTGPYTAGAFIRFTVSALNDNNDLVSIDNLSIAAVTGTSVNYITTFTENGADQDIASNPLIVESGEIVSARIVLTNAQAGDGFDIPNNLPGNIDSSVDLSVAGQITVSLTGTGTIAEWQQALQAVEFRNTSDAPSTVDRVVQVTVNNGFMNSNVATTTISVVAVDDPVNANNDTVITNISGTASIVVPKWALLANDTDPDSPITITGVSGANSLTNLAHNASSVTFTDPTTGTAGGSFTYTATGAPGDTDNASVTVTRDATGSIDGTTGNNILIGNDASSTFDGGLGDDIVFAGGGNDTIVWNANNNGATDGRDFADGGAGSDTFVVTTRAGTNESFRVYTVDAALNGPNAIVGLTAAGLRPGTEIIITRTTGGGQVNAASIIAELDNIEEIRIGNQTSDPTNGPAGGGDSVAIFGNFNETSLALSTITIEGNAGDDTVDISSLTSAHRIVFRSNGGNDTIIGALRPQDVIELPDGTTIADYEVSIDEETGQTVLTGEEHSLTFFAPNGMPNFLLDDDDDDDDDDVGGDDDDAGTVSPGSIAGTPLADVLLGTASNDAIVALGGDDILRGEGGDDFLSGGAGRDMVFGGAGNDDILGGAGADMLYGDDGSDRIFGDEGDDLIDAGAGNDHVQGGAGNDTILATVGDGDDIYWGDGMSASCGDGIDTLDMSAITAAITANLGTGAGGRGSASSSQSGSDVLWGIENIVTGSGNDVITASSAVNVMDGGAGNDTFRFLSAADADGDTILGFQPGDRIDLSAIDADTGSSNHQFTLVTGSGFNAAGALRVTYETVEGQDYTLVQGNTNGGDDAKFTIRIKGHQTLTASDFDL